MTRTCTYCGATPGQPCVVTLDPEVGPLSVPWHHHAREEEERVA